MSTLLSKIAGSVREPPSSGGGGSLERRALCSEFPVTAIFTGIYSYGLRRHFAHFLRFHPRNILLDLGAMISVGPKTGNRYIGSRPALANICQHTWTGASRTVQHGYSQHVLSVTEKLRYTKRRKTKTYPQTLSYTAGQKPGSVLGEHQQAVSWRIRKKIPDSSGFIAFSRAPVQRTISW